LDRTGLFEVTNHDQERNLDKIINTKTVTIVKQRKKGMLIISLIMPAIKKKEAIAFVPLLLPIAHLISIGQKSQMRELSSIVADPQYKNEHP